MKQANKTNTTIKVDTLKGVLWKKYKQLASYLLPQFREIKLHSDWIDKQCKLYFKHLNTTVRSALLKRDVQCYS